MEQRAEEQCRTHCPQRIPAGEDGQRHHNPADPAGHALRPRGPVGDGEESAGHSRQHPAEDHGEVPHQRNVDPHGIRRGRRLSGRAQDDPPPRVIEQDPQDDREQRAQRRKHRELRQGSAERRAFPASSEQSSQAQPEHGQSQPRDELVGAQGHGDKRMQQRRAAANHRGDCQPQHRMTAHLRHSEREERAQDHHAFHTEIHDPGPLRIDLPQRPPQQWCAECHASDQHVDEPAQRVTDPPPTGDSGPRPMPGHRPWSLRGPTGSGRPAAARCRSGRRESGR